MATLRNKRKLATVPRETPEDTTNSQSQNTLDPEMAQENISQVSQEIEGRVIEKFSKEFSRTESRILGALSKLDEFLLNQQVRAYFVAVPRTSRNTNSENREPTGDRSQGDPCCEAVFSTYHCGNLNGSELEETHHRNILIAWFLSEKAELQRGFSEDWMKKKRCHFLLIQLNYFHVYQVSFSFACVFLPVFMTQKLSIDFNKVDFPFFSFLLFCGSKKIGLKVQLLEVSSGSESVRLLGRLAENSTSGWGSLWERSPLWSWFSTSVFLNVPGVVPENFPICEFRRTSSSLDKAPKMWDSVLLNSWDVFIVMRKHYCGNLCYIILSNSKSSWVLRLVVPRILLCFTCHSCYFPLISQCCHNLGRGKSFNNCENWIVLFLKLRITQLKFVVFNKTGFQATTVNQILQLRNNCSTVQP